MGSFKYEGRDAKTVQDRANKSGGDYDDWHKGNAYKPKDGNNAVRILPRTWDAKDGPGADGYLWGDNWAIEVWLHRDIGPDNQTYLCPDKMLGKPCPICEARGEIDDAELVKALKPKTQLLAYMIDRNDEKAGVQPWRVPKGVENEIQTRSVDKKTGAVILVDHPDDGFDVSFKKKGSGLNTDYAGVEIDRDPSYLSEKQSRQDDWLEFIQDNPITNTLIYYDYDYLEKAFRAVSKKGGDKRERGRDKDEPTRSSRDRGRGRDEPAEEEDRRGRSRDREEARETPSRERGRRDEPEEDDRRERGRSREAEPEERGRGRERSRDRDEEERPSRERSRDRDDDDKPEGRERSRERARDPEPEERSTGRVRGTRDEVDDEIPSKRGREPAPRTRERSRAPVEESGDPSDAEEEPEVKPGKASTRAKEALKAMRKDK